MSVLTGTITLHAEGQLWQEVDYQTIQEKLRSELDYFVDEPEFIEMFECVISLGAHTNSYIQELLEFGDRFVDSKFRQLRLSAFTEVNKIPGSCPRSKLAILKRAYRKKPQYGYCPSPEASWKAVPETQLLDLESLLQYFHFNCKAAVAEAIPKENVIAFLSNVDVAASEAFCVEKREKFRKQAMLKAIVKYYEQLHDKASEKLPEKASLEKTKFEWIDFASCLGSQPEVKTAAVADEIALKPKVLHFDEATGELVGAGQARREEKDKKGENASVPVPWRDWQSLDLRSALGAPEADMAAALLVLRMLHTAELTAPIQIMYDPVAKTVRVIAKEDIPERSLELPPCVPKASKIFKESTHPRRVEIGVVHQTAASARKRVASKTSQGGSEAPAEAVALAETTSSAVADTKGPGVGSRTRNAYFVHPEWVMPELEHGADGVEWKWASSVTMHPFWAIRRLSQDQLNAKTKDGPPASPEAFNCELTERQFSVCNVGRFGGGSLSLTVFVEIQLMTNFVEIKRGQELLFEVTKKDAAKRKACTWKEDARKPRKEPKATPAESKAASSANKGSQALEI